MRSRDLYTLGSATKVSARHSLANRQHDAKQRQAAKAALQHPPMRLTGAMARMVGVSLGPLGLPVHALSIMPDHVHAVLGATDIKVEQMVRRMKQAGTVALRRTQQVAVDQPVWVRSGWFVYLNHDADVQRAIRYVEANPTRAGLRPQRWSCVTPWRGGNAQV